MTVSWTPVILIDIVGSVLTLLVALLCLLSAHRLATKRSDDIFRQYIFLLTLAIVIFAVSRSFGHLVKQLLLLNGLEEVWRHLSPFSGAINSISFVVVFAFGIYFHRFQKIHLEIESYKNDLEEKVTQRTEELEEAKLTLENVLNNSNPICITNLDFELVQANTAYEQIWGNIEANAVPPKCYESRPGFYCHSEACPLTQIVNGKVEVIQEAAKTVAGKEMEFIVTARPFRNTKGELIGIVESFQDISVRKVAERKMEKLAFYDPLTQLPNRRLFKERLQRELVRAKRQQAQVGLMFLDLDNFKHVNDSLGHSAGDQLLEQVAERLRETVRESDTVARMGGDEFTVIASEVKEKEDLAALAEKLLVVLRQPVTIGGQDIVIGASIGIAIYPEDGINIDKLMKNADIAMYASKSRGRNRFHFFSPEMLLQNDGQ